MAKRKSKHDDFITMCEKNKKLYTLATTSTPSCSLYDAASLRSLAPDADGVSDSRVRVQLPSDRRANKFDRGFPSVDDIEGEILALKRAVDEEKKEKK